MPPGRRIQVDNHETIDLESAWELAAVPPNAQADLAALDGLDWMPALVPGTAASALAASGDWHPHQERDFDAQDWWFRTSFGSAPPAEGEQVVLCLDGLATVAEVHLNGELVLSSDSMFLAYELDVGARVRERNELAIRFRALSPMLQVRRRPRARWRTRVVAEGNLRFFRTSLLGRAPGFAPRPAAVGPWRPVRLERRRKLVVEELGMLPRVVDDDGLLEVSARLRTVAGEAASSAEVILSGPSGTLSAPLAIARDGGSAFTVVGQLKVPAVALWWPHTHGEPVLYEAVLRVGGTEVRAGGLGFRTLAPGPSEGHNLDDDGLSIHVNAEPIFCRGAVWTPADPVGLAPAPETLRESLQLACDAGMNMLRVPGVGVYETDAFHDLCDELGVLVWQDFMFANLDYPFADERFQALVRAEATQVLARLSGRPSTSVLCGNSEVEQQVAMLGLDPALGRGEMYAQTLPTMAGNCGLDAIYLPSAPCGGELPFTPSRGVANYFGVGGYMRPLEDVRRAEVRFASECLAFSNVSDQADAEASKAGIPRDVGAGWDFEDVRDHYLEQIFNVDAAELRRADHARYLELSRAVTGELAAEVFGEWRRAASPCGGGLVLWWRDLAPGAGWGLLDHSGAPKVAYHHLRRALAPVAVWSTDEGLGGVAIHIANDRAWSLRTRLRVALYRDLEARVGEASEELEIPAHCQRERTVEGMLGRFVDVSWAYRFGPPAQDAIVISLESAAEPRALLAQSVRFPAGRPSLRETAERLGLEGMLLSGSGGEATLAIRSRRLAYGLRVHVSGFTCEDDAFCVEPGGERVLGLRPARPGSVLAGGTLTALNLDDTVQLVPPGL